MRSWELPGRTGTTAWRAVARCFYSSAGTYAGAGPTTGRAASLACGPPLSPAG